MGNPNFFSSKSLLMNVNELFSNNIFVVPDYQRNYAWVENNWKDFWEDIKDGLTTDTPHYWGTIMLKSIGNLTTQTEKGKDIIHKYEIVDGQQRISTIYLFLYVLYIKGKADIFERDIKIGNYYKLELTPLNNQYMQAALNGKDVNTKLKSNINISKAIDYFKFSIDSLVNYDNAARIIYDYLMNNTFFLVLIADDELIAYKAFESLNNRGRQLNLLDKTKGYLMYYSMRYLDGTLNERIQKAFSNILEYYDEIKTESEDLGIEYLKTNAFSENELLRFFYHYFAYDFIEQYDLNGELAYNMDASSEHVYEHFIKKSCLLIKEYPVKLYEFLDDFMQDFEHYVKSLLSITQLVRNKSDNLTEILCLVGLSPILYPLLISMKLHNLLDSKMLNLIDTLNFRVYKLKGSEAKGKIYKEIVCKIKNVKNTETIYNEIANFIEIHCSNSTLKNILDGNVYNDTRRRPLIKYILWEFEKSIYKSINKSFNSKDMQLYKELEIEHIYAQTTPLKMPAYGFNDYEDYMYNIDRLGNLTLLLGNEQKKVSNMVPSDKALIYQTHFLTINQVLGHKICNNGFYKKDESLWGNYIANFCLKRWGVNSVATNENEIIDTSKFELMTDEIENRIDTEDIENLDFTVPTYNALKRAGINKIQDLIDSKDQLHKIRNLNNKRINEIKEKLNGMGIKFMDY